MKAKWPSALGSLDQHVDALDEVAQQLESAHPVNVASAIEELKATEESVRNLRTMLLAEVPDADWNNREELNTLVHARHVEQQRSRLVALAAELERGQISHRRAARVTQLNELREEAVKELRYLSGIEDEPPALPGPEAGDWVQWACSLKEPEDTESLQALRKGFAYLDEFVASLEPGMWQVEGAAPLPDVALDAEDIQMRRSRLVAMAAELERGSIVHHRALRVTQMNQLRDEAVKELRAYAAVHGIPPDLPGPEPAQWVAWACQLKEPDDAEALQKLRARFDHLDEFVAGLEPEMWVAGTATATAAAAAPAAAPATATKQTTTTTPKAVAAAAAAGTAPRKRAKTPEPAPAPQKQATVEDTLLDTSSVPAKAAEPPVETHIFREIVASADVETAPDLKTRLLTIWQEKRRMLVAVAAVLVVAILATILWRGHRTQASNPPPKPPDTKPAELAASTTAPQPTVTTTTTPAPADKKEAKPKDETAAAPKPPAEKEATLLDNAGLRTPQAIPKNAVAHGEEASVSGSAIAGALPGSGSVPNGVMNIVKNVPVAQPKIRASSGVAQGELIHRVEPLYPAPARAAGVQGTVTLQALVAKDGRVRAVKVVKGPPLLSQAAADAVRQWRYKPFMLNGEPTEADIQVNINFQQ